MRTNKELRGSGDLENDALGLNSRWGKTRGMDGIQKEGV